MCVFVYMRVFVCVYVFVYMCVYVCVCMCMFVCVFVYMCVYVCVCVFVYMCVCVWNSYQHCREITQGQRSRYHEELSPVVPSMLTKFQAYLVHGIYDFGAVRIESVDVPCTRPQTALPPGLLRTSQFAWAVG